MPTLAAHTDLIQAELADVIDVFDREIRSDLAFVNDLTGRIRAYRGKLLRPQLLLLSGKACGELRPEHITLAAVVEMVHMATLVHDDVLDEADVRRRSPTVNRLVGNEAAVLLGDYLISHSYHLCSSLGSTRASRRIADVTNTVCEGELLQIANRGNWALNEDIYLEIVRRKTAALTSVCSELGAESSGASAEIVRHMAEFGMDLGIAFQIVDDLLDLTATQAEMGKSVGRDAEMGKLTLPAIRFLQRADASGRERLINAMSGGANGDELQELLGGGDAVESSMDTARSYVQSALQHLSVLPGSDARDALAAAAEFVTLRRQ
ncbi:MAG: polyprenyl synthetase family protein [Planctomycetes bacterium]|nr:polyprenyl synthetase family protein [Planctomycetota bacterium]